MVTKECSSFTERDDLGVCRWIGVSDVSVISAADNVAAENDDCADGNFSEFESALGAAESFVHPHFVGDGCQMFLGVRQLVG